MLERSAALAAQAGQYDVAQRALDAMGQRFQVDSLLLKEAALISAARLAKAGEYRLVAEAWKELADRAVTLDRYEDAKRFLQEGASAARKTTDKPLVALLADCVKDLDAIRSAYEDVAPAREAYWQNPQDASAAAWGRFCCLYKNDWDAGLPIWAAGVGDPLADIARQDLAQPVNPSEQLKLADAWWNAATGEETPLPKKWLKARAATWYRRAQPALSGLDRDKAAKRVTEAEQATSPFPQGQWVEVLGMVDLSKHVVAGEWVRRGNVIATIKSIDWSRIMIPVALDGS